MPIPKAIRLRISTFLRKVVIIGVVVTTFMSHANASPTLTIGEQFGLPYLLFYVAQDQHLIEKYAAKEGIDNLSVNWRQISGGAEMNAALLAGSLDIGTAGVGPTLTLWDRTHGNANVQAITAIGSAPIALISINPDVHSIKELTSQDRIAVPATSVSVQSRILQMAAAKEFGPDQWNKFDPQTVSMSHPDAAAAIISGGTEITTHFANTPYNYLELQKNPKAHQILSSYDVQGHLASANLAFATQRFHDHKPKLYAAFVNALKEASQFVTQHPDEAAQIYKRVTGDSLDTNFVASLIKKPEFDFSITPRHTWPMAHFMHSIGAIKNDPKQWQDYFFPEGRINGGS